ncbi:class I SAM-dependent methyltransferase [Simiduia sp. 21SJ11W-1]|uniref:DUF938 domain-containing protein n=1 Tax=Simiduia sp. 21SJ11W-1 TaxID=2909669 RepID=UPI00209D7954|nr:DUF938 domain-containing protein [Simiduia sp. 21SJ11W-1]UTA47976.1 class I SAM-dependent methyltransferase [Simiduia sp. 21SJ11W-1]
METQDLKPFSQASQNNRDPILHHLKRLFADRRGVLEIGSGTGQHAVHFAKAMPHLEWYTSDLPEHHEGIQLWLNEYPLENLHPPLTLDVLGPWPALEPIDAAYTANTAHIMPWEGVEAMFAGIAERLPAGGLWVVYGPMNYGGSYTSESNARFDVWLKAQDPARGIRDYEKLMSLGQSVGLDIREDNEMPANNRLLVWQKA